MCFTSPFIYFLHFFLMSVFENNDFLRFPPSFPLRLRTFKVVYLPSFVFVSVESTL